MQYLKISYEENSNECAYFSIDKVEASKNEDEKSDDNKLDQHVEREYGGYEDQVASEPKY